MTLGAAFGVLRRRVVITALLAAAPRLMVGGHATNAIDVTNCQPLTKPSNGVQDHSRDTELYHVCADVERAWNMGQLFNPNAALIDVFTSGQRGFSARR